MSRTNYSPALAAVYLDADSQEFLIKNLKINLWKQFFHKIQHPFPNLPIHLLVSEELNLKIEPLLVEFASITLHAGTTTEEGFLKSIAEALPESKFNDPDWDEVCFLYFKGISPLADQSLMKTAWDRHKKFFSQYSYSENLPEGIIPYILTREFLATLPDKLPNDVHAFFLKNINQYDVDIFYIPPDLRQYRFDFRLNDVRNATLIESLLEKDSNISYDQILPAIKARPNIFRLSPSYIEWEIYKGCELECSFCPRQFIDKSNEPTIFTFENVKSSIDKMDHSFSTPYTICLGGNGEPLLHPNINEIIHEILKESKLKELIIETALYKNVDSFLTFLTSLDESLRQKLTIIVNFSTLKPDTYSRLYGKNLHSTILTDIGRLKLVLPPSSLHVQMIKMIEVGDEVEAYFTFFEQMGINVILQKYNRFAGKLPEKRVSDLTPIHRDFCWHLNRDLVIDVSGNVSICKQNTTEILGNVLTEDLLLIWEKGQKHFAATLLGNHGEIPAPCLNCDEWYTFNA
jgi:spiro-SPASM protein